MKTMLAMVCYAQNDVGHDVRCLNSCAPLYALIKMMLAIIYCTLFKTMLSLFICSDQKDVCHDIMYSV